jgi:hypothetical protein
MTQEWPLLVLVMSGASGAMKASGWPLLRGGLVVLDYGADLSSLPVLAIFGALS